MKEQFRLISPQVVLSSIGLGKIPSRSAISPAQAAEHPSRFRDALAYVEKIDNSPPIECPEFPRGSDWINSRPLSLSKELKGKVVLLDFFTYCCINCQHVLAKLRELEDKHGLDGSGGVVVVGVHSAKFSAERETQNIAAAVERYGVRHPVINDERMELWNGVGVSAWPTLALVGPTGNLLALWSGERQEEDIGTIISAALNYYSDIIDHRPLPEAPKQNFGNRRPLASPLRYPGKVALSRDGNSLFVADSGNNRVLEIDANTNEVRRAFGSGEADLKDSSDPTRAAFHFPQGLVEYDGVLYVADTESHAVRAINLNSGVVDTIGGNGTQGYDYAGGKVGTSQQLSSPWDVEVRNGVLYVAMAGTHQIWSLELPKNNTKREYSKPWEVFSGSGREMEKNASNARRAGWAQPSHLSASGDTLFVADSESSSVRAIDLQRSGHPTKTIAGGDGLIPENLFAFGDREGRGAGARFQHPLAVCWDETRDLIYVADSYNHRIKVVDETGSSKVFCGTGAPGLRDGTSKQAMFWEPAGLTLSADGAKLFVSDTNNFAIRVVDTDTRQVTTVDIKEQQSGGSKSTSAKRLIPNRKRAVRITCDDVSPQAMLSFSIALPQKSHFTPGTTSRYQVNIKGNDGASSEEPTLVILDKGQLTESKASGFFSLDLTKLASKVGNFSGIEVETVTYYCTEEDDVCRTEADVFNLEISESGLKESNVKHEIAKKTQPPVPLNVGTV